jgi:hypothetical protein
MYCDYFIWCVSCTVVVLTCFVICVGVRMCGFCNVWLCVCVGVLVISVRVFTVFHCFTVHFNSLCIMAHLMQLYIIKH